MESRKISKAIYLLVEKYHRLFGLEVYGFNSGHGPGYAGFQIAANRCWEQGKATPNYGASFGDGRLVLVTYFTNVGIPAWCAGEQVELEDWERQRTSTILNWLEKHLSLRELFDLYKSDIASWRSQCTVEESEKYLLMINLAGIVSTRLNDFPRVPEQLYYGMNSKGAEKIQRAVTRLGVDDENIDVFGVSSDCLIARNGLALVGNEIVDVWAMRVQGHSCEMIADYLWEALTMGSDRMTKSTSGLAT